LTTLISIEIITINIIIENAINYLLLYLSTERALDDAISECCDIEEDLLVIHRHRQDRNNCIVHLRSIIYTCTVREIDYANVRYNYFQHNRRTRL